MTEQTKYDLIFGILFTILILMLTCVLAEVAHGRAGALIKLRVDNSLVGAQFPTSAPKSLDA